MNPLSIQDRLDRGGEVIMPVGSFRPDYPLFVSSHTTVRGCDRGSMVDAAIAGTAFIVGWRRGMLSAGHHVAGGFRTKGDSNIFARGTEWDLGPPGGWPTIRRLIVTFAATLHDSPSGSWDGLGLCGIVADPHVTDTDGSLSGGSYWGPRPAPFSVSFSGGKLVVWVGTDDPNAPYREWRFDADIINPVLHIRVYIDADSGNVDVLRAPLVDRFDNAFPLVQSFASHPNQSFTFVSNHLWPFHAGSVDPYVASGGSYWGSDWYDATIRFCYLDCDRGPAKGWTVGTMGAGTNFPDYLPLVACTAGPTRYLLTPVRGQEIPDTAARVRFDDVVIRGAPGNPAILLGTALDAEFRHLHILGGTRAISCTGLAVNYPMTIDRCKFEGQSDRNLFLYKSTRIDVRRSMFEQGRWAAATLFHCGGIIAECSVYPPPAAQHVVFDQLGGGMTYERIPADYEADFRPRAFIELTPTSVEQGFDPTTTRVTDCTVGGVPGDVQQSPLVTVKPSAGWYTAPVSVKLNQTDPRECQVVSAELRAVIDGAKMVG